MKCEICNSSPLSEPAGILKRINLYGEVGIFRCQHHMGQWRETFHAMKSDRIGRGCLFAGVGRGDCLHFTGLPPNLGDSYVDDYGKPYHWCWSCWKDYKLAELSKQVRILKENR